MLNVSKKVFIVETEDQIQASKAFPIDSPHCRKQSTQHPLKRQNHGAKPNLPARGLQTQCPFPFVSTESKLVWTELVTGETFSQVRARARSDLAAKKL